MDKEDEIFRRHLTECPYNNATQIFWRHGVRPHQEDVFGYECIHQSEALVRKLCQGVFGMNAYLSNGDGKPENPSHTVAVSQKWGRYKLYESSLMAQRPIDVSRMYEDNICDAVGIYPSLSNGFLRCTRYSQQQKICVDFRRNLHERYEPSEKVYEFLWAEMLPHAEFGKVYNPHLSHVAVPVLRMHWLQEHGTMTSVQMDTTNGEIGIRHNNGIHQQTVLRSHDKPQFNSWVRRIENQRGIVRGGLIDFFQSAWELYKVDHPNWQRGECWI